MKLLWTLDSSDSVLKKEEKKEPCKGLVFRYRESSYFNPERREFIYKDSFRLLERKSCKGCPQCEWMWEFIDECGMDGVVIEEPHPKDMALFTLMARGSRDWETGHWELEYLELVPYTEPTDKEEKG